MIVVVVDPNVRVEGNLTYVGFEDAPSRIGWVPEVGERLIVQEPESGLQTTAVVRRVDISCRLAYLEVDWAAARIVQRVPYESNFLWIATMIAAVVGLVLLVWAWM